MNRKHFIIIAVMYIAAVFFLASTTPISAHEAKHLYASSDIVSDAMQFGRGITDTFLGLRLVFVFLGLLSIALFYAVSRNYLKESRDAYLATTIFMLLPGILTGATLANIAIMVLPVILLFVLMYEKGYFWGLPLLMLILFFIHEASIIFFVAVLLYALKIKDRKMAITASAFLLAFVYMAKGIVIGGRPSGHFVEIFGLYATLFSPFVFVYFFYAMYRILLRGKKSLLWYISFTALAFSLLLSIRQKIHLTDFAPYVMIAVALMLKVYYQSLRVRLPKFQKIYKLGFTFVIVTLALNTLLILTHQYTYYLSDTKEKHFAKRIYEPYEIAKRYKSEGKSCVECYDSREKLQYRYYGIPVCNK